MNQWAKFRTQLILQLLLTLTSIGLVAWLAARGEGAAASLWGVPTIGLITRVVVLVRLHRMGNFAEDPAQRPSPAVASRQVSVIFIVQFVAWLAAACYCAATAFWVPFAVALFLALSSLAMTIFLRRLSPQLPQGFEKNGS
jgi:hypothetical protein